MWFVSVNRGREPAGPCLGRRAQRSGTGCCAKGLSWRDFYKIHATQMHMIFFSAWAISFNYFLKLFFWGGVAEGNQSSDVCVSGPHLESGMSGKKSAERRIGGFFSGDSSGSDASEKKWLGFSASSHICSLCSTVSTFPPSFFPIYSSNVSICVSPSVCG